MTARFKYIVTESVGFKTAIIFPEIVPHANAVREGVKPLSAGFAEIRDGRILAHGQSTSLNLASKPGDAQILAFTLTAMGIHHPQPRAKS
jgi:hypothetical protein